MKPCSLRYDRRAVVAILAAIGYATRSLADAAAADVVTRFQETDETFANPGQGWMTTRRMPDVSGRFPYSVAYFRLNWEDIEPEANWIGSPKYAQVQGFADQWKRAPVIFEWFGPYDYLLERGWSFDRALDFMAANHVTFIDDNVGKVPPEQMPKLEQLARRAGYRFVLREVSYPENLSRGETLTVNMRWSNVGVGKLYRRYPLVVYLLDAAGAIRVQQTQADIDVTDWLPGDWSVGATWRLPADLQAGQYTLGLALVDPASEKPAIRLAIDAPHADRLYAVGAVRVK